VSHTCLGFEGRVTVWGGLDGWWTWRREGVTLSLCGSAVVEVGTGSKGPKDRAVCVQVCVVGSLGRRLRTKGG
jgi:hypothetical protein